MLSVYEGEFGAEQATRLLWRAGFGPRGDDARRLAGLGLQGAVRSLTRPGRERLVGPAPHDDKKRPLAPYDAWGHDHLWWLDRMVRTSRPLVERMTLVWHDWFATSNAGVGSQRLMLNQNALLRTHALGSFASLLHDVTRDPAMLIWLNGSDNSRSAPNENYAREMMELFTLGAGHGYTERDVREQARALTGFRNDWRPGVGAVEFRYDRERHDPGKKWIFHHGGTFDWQDACSLCLQHPAHPPFLVGKLWSYFVPTPPPPATKRSLERLYVQGGRQVRPLLEAILVHPALYEGPRMVKPPVVQLAGMLRGAGRGIDTTAWAWISELMGQKLFYPPNVAGWDDTRWLDTATFRARWIAAGQLLQPAALSTKTISPKQATTPDDLLASALAFWGDPAIGAPTRAALISFAQAALATANQSWKKQQYPVLVENALRQLIAVSPDFQTA